MKQLSFIFILLTLTSCATPYYGHSEKEWRSLSAEQKNAIKLEYEIIIHTKNVQKHQEKINAITETIVDRGTNPPPR